MSFHESESLPIKIGNPRYDYWARFVPICADKPTSRRLPPPTILRCDTCDRMASSENIQDGTLHKGCSASPRGRLRERDLLAAAYLEDRVRAAAARSV